MLKSFSQHVRIEASAGIAGAARRDGPMRDIV